MKLFWAVLLGLVLSQPLAADELERVLRFDLNNDGRTETIGLRPYDGRYYESDIVLKQLVVLDQAGGEIWSGPKGEWRDPLVFGGPYDGFDLHAIGKVGGKITLIGDYQRSDVRPTVFRLFQWDGRAFVASKEAALIPRENSYVWVPADDSVMCESWVDEVMTISPEGAWRVKVTSIPEQGTKVLDIEPANF